jgi:hypothetical protein
MVLETKNDKVNRNLTKRAISNFKSSYKNKYLIIDDVVYALLYLRNPDRFFDRKGIYTKIRNSELTKNRPDHLCNKIENRLLESAKDNYCVYNDLSTLEDRIKETIKIINKEDHEKFLRSIEKRVKTMTKNSER